jgi:deoxyribonuclease IV
MSPLRIGAHVDQTDPIAEAAARSADLAQFFLGDPQGWKGPKVAYEQGAAALRADAQSAGIDLYVHAPYVLNVATTNNRIRIPSRKLLQQAVDAAAEIGAKAVVVHGGHLLKGEDPAVGLENWRKCVEQLEKRCPVLLENTAGGDNAMARRLDRIAMLWDVIADSGIGFCFDTCHAHASGIELDTAFDKIMAITGRIDLVHANGSRDPFDSGADRHTNLDAGEIDVEAIMSLVRAAGAPVVVETPGGAPGQSADIQLLRAKAA